MTFVNVTELRRNLPSYIARVGRGEEVYVTRRGQVIAVLKQPLERRERARQELDALRERAKVGDVESPIDMSWDADNASA